MACSNPYDVAQLGDGSISFDPSFSADVRRRLKLACGKCGLCLAALKREAVSRMVLEASCHRDSICFTLTYSDDKLPPLGSLSKRDAVLFIKRLREWWQRETGQLVRVHLVGEYSPTLMRPHYHGFAFGLLPPDTQSCGHVSSKARSPEFESAKLTELWGKGRVTFQLFSVTAAQYLAKHQASKLRRAGSGALVVGVDADGVVQQREPEFAISPRRPALGRAYFERNAEQVLALDFVVVGGRRVPMPRYFARLALKSAHGSAMESVQHERWLEAQTPERLAESTPERLAVREFCEAERVRRAEVERPGRIR